MFSKDNHPSRRFTLKKVVSMILVFIAIASALSTVVMLLWNAILPDVVGVKPLTFWKAMGLLVLAKLLFGGLGKAFGGRYFSKKKHWRNKWMSMSHEERKEAKQRWKEHCRKRKNNES